MKRRIITLLLAALVGTLASCDVVYAQRRAHAQAPTWQGSVTPAVRLGLRDQFASLGSFQAVFIVTTRAGQRYTATVQAAGDGFADAVFPRDFPGASGEHEGRYTWECIVQGATVMRGTFTFQSSLTFSTPARKRGRQR